MSGRSTKENGGLAQRREAINRAPGCRAKPTGGKCWDQRLVQPLMWDQGVSLDLSIKIWKGRDQRSDTRAKGMVTTTYLLLHCIALIYHLALLL